MDTKLIAEQALLANPQVVSRIESAGPKGQYKAVGRTIAKAIAKKAGCSEHKATWACVNYVNSTAVEDEEINDF